MTKKEALEKFPDLIGRQIVFRDSELDTCRGTIINVIENPASLFIEWHDADYCSWVMLTSPNIIEFI